MRLLTFDNHGGLCLTEDLYDIPAYAILSHTWGDDYDEVTFDDLKQNSFQSKAGYTKIQFCGEQAKKDGLKYFWVDTCCINKANNTEYSEAINSMFRWYRDAAKCYVYLSDVSVSEGDETQTKRTWKLAFRKSRWFTRGWTLQELLAPTSVDFFSREGEWLGDKRTLEQQIHEITEIPIAALCNEPLSRFSVEERLRWTAKRETTKKEDQAYCLLGIFGIFMPLIYGERENAFVRLRRAIDSHEKGELQYHSDQHRQCHRALKTSTYEQFKDVNPDRVEGTCRWMLSHHQYRQWHEKPYDDLLWISADPGCGKSVLAKSLVDHELQNTDQHTVCHFFFKDNDEQDHAVTALCALLHQLFSHQPWLIPYAIPAWEKTGDKVAKEEAELWRILLDAATANDAYDVTCVLDALDECRPSDRRWLINMLSRFYTEVSPRSSRRGRLKFLVTSRPYDDIRADFQKTVKDLPTIRLRGEEENEQIHREIDLVIRMRVGHLARDLQLDSDLQNKLETTLLKMGHRTYLWLHLAVDDIYETFRNSIRPEQESIELLPSSVEDAYEKILARVSLKQKYDVKKILQVVVGARRPLTIDEMAIALGIATTVEPKSLNSAKLDSTRLQSNIRDLCGLFIFINHDRIYLIHQTAKEFLISNPNSIAAPSGWKYCLHTLQIEKEMTRICVKFLHMEDVCPTARSLIRKFDRYHGIDDILDRDDPTQSFLAYSAEYWPSHLREADTLPMDCTITDILRLYKTGSNLYHQWFAIFWKAGHPYEDEPQMNAIRLAAFLGHEQVLKTILQLNKDPNINEPDEDGRTGLIWASQNGHRKVVQVLLDKGTDPNAQGGWYGNALQAASVGGHEEVVQMLLDKGADPNAQGGKYRNALYAASAGGHEKVVQILLDKGTDPNTQGGKYGNALQAASAGGHEKVVQILLEKGAAPNAQGGWYGNALQAASEDGHETVVQILLDKGADPNARGGWYGNALQAASEGGHQKVKQMLLDRGADASVKG